jgi:ketosteroid isomerase-like protein
MSRETGELADRVAEWLNQRDLLRLIEIADPEVECYSFFALGEGGGVYRGHDGIRQWLNDVNDAFEVVYANVDDRLVAGDVAVLVGRIHFRGKGSGVETELPVGWVLKFRQGKLMRFRAFREPEQAVERMGQSE